MMDKVFGTDSTGYPTPTLVPSVSFRAGIYPVKNAEAIIAGRVGSKAIFIIQTDREMLLEQNDYVYRPKDGRTYRITGNSIDNLTPDVASDQYAEVTAEVVS